MTTLIDTLSRRLQEGRDGATMRFALGKALLDEGEAAAALVHLREAVRQDPDYSAAWAQLGRCEQTLGDLAAAIAAWRQGHGVAERRGDAQTVRQIAVWLKKAEARAAAG